jgi:hypothetical protein
VIVSASRAAFCSPIAGWRNSDVVNSGPADLALSGVLRVHLRARPIVSCETSLSVRWTLSNSVRSYILPEWESRRLSVGPRVDVLRRESENLTHPKSVVFSLNRDSPRISRIVIWLILPVAICLSQRLSHACPSTSLIKVKPRMAH